MDLITLKLAQLGEGCIVANAEGKEFIDLSKVRSAVRGYKDEWEIQFTVSASKKTTTNGYRILHVCESQTREEREAKKPFVFIGNGITLFERSADDRPAPSVSVPTPAPVSDIGTPKKVPTPDLPF